MRKILFLTATLNIGGAEKVLYEVVRHLDSARFSIKVCCLYGPGAIGEALVSKGIDLQHGFMKNKYDIAGIYRFYLMLKREGVDLLYLQGSPLTLFWGFICARLARVPHLVTTIHATMTLEENVRFKSRIINRLILHRLDRIIVVSKAKLDSLAEEYGLRRERLLLIHNGIDADRFINARDVIKIKKALGIAAEEKVIGMVARLVNKKGYDIFLQSAQKILSRVPKSKFLIIGKGEEWENLERLATELGIKKHVIFLGEREDAQDLIRLFDVAVLSSRDESLPVAILEYMLASRPIVVTNVGGNRELVLHGETGLVVPPEDPDSLANAVIDLLGDGRKARNMRIAARKRVEKEFSLRTMIQKIDMCFSDIISSPGMEDSRCHVILTGPRLDRKGGIASFIKYYLELDTPKRFKIIHHPTVGDGSNISKLVFFIKSFMVFLIRLIFDRRVKVVHIFTASNGSFYRKAVILLSCKFFKKKTVFHIHGGGFGRFYKSSGIFTRCLIRKILNLSDTIVVLSKSWSSEVSNMTKNPDIRVIPNSIDTAVFENIACKRDYSNLNILTLGHLERQKGTYDILDIVPAVLKEIPRAKFYLAGDGELEEIRNLCREKRIEEGVVLLGWLDRDALLRALENASIFLLPSYYEGLPIAMLEAMASGLPVISTRVGGIPETIEEGINGFLVEPGQKDELAKRIIGLLKEERLRERMGKDNFKKANSLYRLDRIAERFYAEYERLAHKALNTGRYKIKWYLERLSCMSFQEIFYRVYKAVELNLKRLVKKDVDLEKVLAEPKEKTMFYFGPDKSPEIRQEFSRLFPKRIDAIVNHAEDIMQHRFRVFNLEWCAGEEIDWHKGKDIRFIWELNRHQHLVTLGKAYLLRGEMRYANEVKDQILSWIRQNPLYMGVNWSSPLEAALRLISWCWAYKFIQPSGVFSMESKKEFLKSVYQQAEFIKDNLSRYSSANNHLIGEASGLVIAALTFKEFKDSKDWLRTGKEILFREIENQIYTDGVTKEQAFYYQAFIMELYLLALTLLAKNGIEIPEAVNKRFFSMAEFFMNVMDKNGKVPHVGDSDNARAVRLSEDSYPSLFKSILSGLSILSERGDFKAKAEGFSEENYWLFGIEGFKRFKRIDSDKHPLSSKIYREGGYAVLRNPSRNGKEDILIMDCGELGYMSLAGHGHADSLGIILTVGGKEVFVDPGTYLYRSGGVWRDYFRSTKAHNTIRIDNVDQSEMTGPFLWGYKAKSYLEYWAPDGGADRVCGYHTGYTRLQDPVIHKREITFDKSNRGIIIKDRLLSKGCHFAEQFFHLHPDCRLRNTGVNAFKILNRGVILLVEIDGILDSEAIRGSEDPICGWYSEQFGEKVETFTICGRGHFKGSVEFITKISIGYED